MDSNLIFPPIFHPFFLPSIPKHCSYDISMALKLYGYPRSGSTACVITCLLEKQVEFELIHVDLFSGQHKSPDFLAKHPFGLVPVLEDGEFTIFETRAITEYVCKKYAANGTEDLLCSDDLRRSALVRTWVEVESNYFHPAMSPIIFQSFVAPLQGMSPDRKVIDESLEKLVKVLDIYEARLQETKYLAGESYSLADLHHLPPMFYFLRIEGMQAKIFDQRSRLKAWWEDVSSRAAFKKVVEGMKLEN
ncbi:hypothetical protein MLD38_012336 [Melastoma candidum]|uniref:Uncharacterized protein n=1 Tax=Melastoma candidum TaxID=119954 RepID=A0ACB9R9L2_9MYRT|nr:hypothetical protein MLD38_012336 [Melastoma candidum]